MNVRTLARRRQRQRLRYTEAALQTLTPAHHCAMEGLAFHSRGARAWQQYQRECISRPVDAVFDELEARIGARRRQHQCRRVAQSALDALAARGQARARLEPPRVELGIRPADLAAWGGQAHDIDLAPRRRQLTASGHITPADGNVFSDLGFPADEAQALLQAAEATRQP